MTVYRNDLKGGTDGSGGLGRITPANSANSGDPFSHVVDTSTARWNYASVSGLGICAVRNADSTSGHLRGLEDNPSGRGGCRRTLIVGANPSSNVVQIQIRTMPGESLIGSLIRDSSNRFSINQGAGVGFVSDSLSGVISEGIYAVELFYTPADPASGGFAEYYVFDDSGTDVFSWSDTLTTNISPPAQFRGGGAAAEIAQDVLSEMAWGSLAEGVFGPAAQDDAGEDQTVEPWSLVTLEGTGPGPWSQVSGTPVTLAGSGTTRTFVAPPAWGNEELVFAYGTDTCKVTVLTATDFFITGTGPKPFYNEMVH